MATKLYQPLLYSDDGTNIDYINILPSFQAFLSKEECEDYLDETDYCLDNVIIEEYDASDIEDCTIINNDGTPNWKESLRILMECHPNEKFHYIHVNDGGIREEINGEVIDNCVCMIVDGDGFFYKLEEISEELCENIVTLAEFEN